METSKNKTTGPGLVRMGVFDMPDTEERICETHGEYKAAKYKFGWTECVQCLTEKQDAENRERQRQDDVERMQRRVQHLFDRAAIPPRFENRSLDTYQAELPGQIEALSVARNFAATFDESAGTSLIFCGGVGSGKTHIAVGIARELIKRHRMALFMTVMSAVRSVKDTWNNTGISETEAIQKLIEPDLLILDEVGVQFGSDTEKMILFEVINGRYENRRSTILISNLAFKELEKFLGERVIDRMREDGGKVVVFDWSSYRRQAV